jgi:hypothetical protein
MSEQEPQPQKKAGKAGRPKGSKDSLPRKRELRPEDIEAIPITAGILDPALMGTALQSVADLVSHGDSFDVACCLMHRCLLAIGAEREAQRVHMARAIYREELEEARRRACKRMRAVGLRGQAEALSTGDLSAMERRP